MLRIIVKEPLILKKQLYTNYRSLANFWITDIRASGLLCNCKIPLLTLNLLNKMRDYLLDYSWVQNKIGINDISLDSKLGILVELKGPRAARNKKQKKRIRVARVSII